MKKMQLKQRPAQKMRVTFKMVTLTAGSILLISGFIKIFILGSLFKPEITMAGPGTAPTLSFTSPTLISGTAGNVNAVYLFEKVTTGVDAQVTLLTKAGGATVSNIDQLGSSTGYDDAFQPIVGMAAGTLATADTSYTEWKIEFKKAGTTMDTIFQSISATAMDVDGGATLYETVQAFNASSYSTDPTSGTELTITKDSTLVTARASTNNYTGIDSLNKTVMFQINFSNVSSIIYRIGGINRGAFVARNTSVYFKSFFSNFSPLPVTLISFSGKTTDNKTVFLNWATAAELNNDYFTLERSSNGNHFTEFVTVEGAGTSSIMHKYSFTDSQPFSGTSYYRLTQTDFDGTSTSYKIVSVNILSKPTDGADLKISPNPFTQTFTAQFELDEAKPVTIQLINVTGAIAFTENIMGEQGSNQYRFTTPFSLNPVAYNLRITNNNNVIASTKVICRK